jgi:hypothetical protein
VDDYEPGVSFGEEMAEVYARVARRGDEQDAAAFLALLAGDGRALERR